ncbi:MAG: Stp1/IreP family PP2C-type Ser/Thr phosphatase [Bryobacteraceae bacterium]|jgi:protein phosphatase
MIVRPGIELANLTDPGCVRERNEDYYCYFEPDDDEAFRARGRLLVVADGMGGHEGGEIASGIAVEVVRQTWSNGTGDPSDLLIAALSNAHSAIQDYAREHPELAGMGTTCTAAALIGDLLYYGHVGDTRLYLIHHGAIRRVTHDHSLVQRLVDSGALTEEQAAGHPDRNVLVSALGMSGAVSVDVPDGGIPIEPGDTLLICTDGLHGLASDAELLDAATRSEPRQACQQLVQLARDRGGPDNITLQIVRLAGAPAQASSARLKKTRPEYPAAQPEPS